MSATPTTVNPNRIKTHDYAMLRLIAGATKSGYQKNRKHEQSRKACRGRVQREG